MNESHVLSPKATALLDRLQDNFTIALASVVATLGLDGEWRYDRATGTIIKIE